MNFPYYNIFLAYFDNFYLLFDVNGNIFFGIYGDFIFLESILNFPCSNTGLNDFFIVEFIIYYDIFGFNIPLFEWIDEFNKLFCFGYLFKRF